LERIEPVVENPASTTLCPSFTLTNNKAA